MDDQLLADMEALQKGITTDTVRYVPRAKVTAGCAVPVYYDQRYHSHFQKTMDTPRFKGFTAATLGKLLKSSLIEVRGGHGSPSHDQRVGDVPYIKVSDLRAGLVNINPTNRVPRAVAKQYWKGGSSGLRAYDLVCPERTSKNIGDFCVLMPGQEQVVMTKEVIILRPGASADFDPFYLLWAMTLKVVRDQWKRIVFMQTNREDVGKRFLEIEIPVSSNRLEADQVSSVFREYYLSIAKARVALGEYLRTSGEHHFFVAGGEDFDEVSAANED